MSNGFDTIVSRRTNNTDDTDAIATTAATAEDDGTAALIWDQDYDYTLWQEFSADIDQPLEYLGRSSVTDNDTKETQQTWTRIDPEQTQRTVSPLPLHVVATEPDTSSVYPQAMIVDVDEETVAEEETGEPSVVQQRTTTLNSTAGTLRRQLPLASAFYAIAEPTPVTIDRSQQHGNDGAKPSGHRLDRSQTASSTIVVDDPTTYCLPLPNDCRMSSRADARTVIWFPDHCHPDLFRVPRLHNVWDSGLIDANYDADYQPLLQRTPTLPQYRENTRRLSTLNIQPNVDIHPRLKASLVPLQMFVNRGLELGTVAADALPGPALDIVNQWRHFFGVRLPAVLINEYRLRATILALDLVTSTDIQLLAAINIIILLTMRSSKDFLGVHEPSSMLPIVPYMACGSESKSRCRKSGSISARNMASGVLGAAAAAAADADADDDDGNWGNAGGPPLPNAPSVGRASMPLVVVEARTDNIPSTGTVIGTGDDDDDGGNIIGGTAGPEPTTAPPPPLLLPAADAADNGSGGDAARPLRAAATEELSAPLGGAAAIATVAARSGGVAAPESRFIAPSVAGSSPSSLAGLVAARPLAKSDNVAESDDESAAAAASAAAGLRRRRRTAGVVVVETEDETSAAASINSADLRFGIATTTGGGGGGGEQSSRGVAPQTRTTTTTEQVNSTNELLCMLVETNCSSSSRLLYDRVAQNRFVDVVIEQLAAPLNWLYVRQLITFRQVALYNLTTSELVEFQTPIKGRPLVFTYKYNDFTLIKK